MKKTLSLIILFIIGGVGVPGCYNCNCPKDTYADISGLNLLVYGKVSPTPNFRIIEANTKISWNEVAYFSIGYAVRTYGINSNQNEQLTHWGSAVYACDCNPPGYLGTQEKLKYITVRTAFNFDPAHPAGSILNELTTVTVNSNTNNIPLNEYLSKGLIPYQQGSRLDLVLNKAPSAKGPFALDITVELDNGEVYTTRTPVIQLQ